MDTDKSSELQRLLHFALEEEKAEMGLIRQYQPDIDELIIVTHHGFPQEFITHYHSTKPFDRSSCGRAFGIGSQVLINDIEQDLSLKKESNIFKLLKVEFRAVKSVPILTPRGKKLGVLSTYFKEPKWDWHFNSNDKILTGIMDVLY